MKSRITKTVALAALMAGAAGVANATEGWYGRADVGYSDGTVELDATTDSYDLGADWSEHLGLGYAFQNGFRLEGEVSHRFNQIEPSGFVLDGDAHAWAGMANLFYDFNRGGGAEPYIGIGAGMARLSGNATDGIFTVAGDDTVVAYQAMIGIALAVSEQLDLDVGYRYFQADGVELDEGTLSPVEADYQNQAVTIGLRYQFAAPVV
ncbi:MAG: outer membrane beta-barrel protein, partial [Terricaulis sp.]